MSIACPACAHSNVDHARFCSECGAALTSAHAERDPIFGTLVHDRYRILRVIGEGGMGRVYYAEQQMGTASRPVAIKVLRAGVTDAAHVQRFYRECEVVVQLTHPSTIRFYDFGKLPDGRLYIAMEYVEGRSLAKAIESGPLPLPLVERFTSQIGGALIEAHRRGIVHRDLKPDNILLAYNADEGEFAKVLDFGIAKQDDASRAEITGEGLIVGTPAYMSPEQLKGQVVDARSDVYALGLIVFEMLTGKRPFNAKTPLEWATKHMTEDPPSFDAFPATAELPLARRTAVMHALAKETDKRTPSVRVFLEEFLGEARLSAAGLTPSGDRLVLRTPSSTPSGDAPTVASTPRAQEVRADEARRAGRDVDEPLRVPTHSWSIAGTVFVVGALLAGAGVAAYVARHTTPAPVVDASPDAAIVASDAGPPAPRREWLRMTTGSARATDVSAALGPPDGACARIEPRGKILVELPRALATSGDDAPDLEVVAEGTTPYRVDVLASRNEERTQVGADVVGSIQVDIDQFERHEVRYVRVKNQNAAGQVCIDAIAVLQPG